MQLDKWARAGVTTVRKVHFVGIGGSGMCGLAEILHGLGYQVSGSDLSSTPTLERLSAAGLECSLGHKAENIAGVDVVVYSTAIAQDNVELVAAAKAGIPLVQRAEMLAEIMRFGLGIAIAGSHGKTTTTSIMAEVLAAGNEFVTFIVGGLVKHAKRNAKLGDSRYVVAEADESDSSFLFLRPAVAVVTNIDAEHMSNYADMASLRETFLTFMQHVPFDGLVVICLDDANLAQLEPLINRPLIKYGFTARADYRARDIKQHEMNTKFIALFPDQTELEFQLSVPGKHNVLNALACIATCDKLGIKRAAIQQGLRDFGGVARRQDILGEFSGKVGKQQLTDILLIDDYGHHPTEIEATLAAFRAAWPQRRQLMIFQPHRYTRTQELMTKFVQVLAQPEQLILLDIYAAGESPIKGINSEVLAREIAKHSQRPPLYLKDPADLATSLPALLASNDLVITQGAGSIGALARELLANSLYLTQ